MAAERHKLKNDSLFPAIVAGVGPELGWVRLNDGPATPAATPDTTCTSPPTQASKPSSTSYIAAELERLSRPGITACNARDWGFTSPAAAEAKQHVAPDYEAYWDGYQRPLTFEENIEGSRQLVEQDPNYPTKNTADTYQQNISSSSSYIFVLMQGSGREPCKGTCFRSLYFVSAIMYLANILSVLFFWFLYSVPAENVQ